MALAENTGHLERRALSPSILPVSRTPPVVRDRQHRDVTRKTDEYDVIWEVVNWKSADVAICDTRNERSCFRKLFKMAESFPNFSRKSGSDRFASLSIPIDGLAQLAACTFAQPNRLQRDNTSR